MEYGCDSKRQNNVPRGVVTKYEWKSQIFAETRRDYWIYVPDQYDSQTPAGLMVFQDGRTYVDEDGWFRVPIVLRQSYSQKRQYQFSSVFSSIQGIAVKHNLLGCREVIIGVTSMTL